MPKFRAFVRLTRPLFLYGGFAGVALGAAVAGWTGHPVGVAAYAWVQALVTSFHLMVHYANDYFDREADAHAARTSWSGGSGVLIRGDLPPRVAILAALGCASAGLAVCGRFALAGDGTVAALGVAILVLSWCYSAPPARFAARGLGEIDTALVVAVLVPCAGYAAFAHALDARLVSALIGPAAAMLAMMLSVELPDAGADAAAGKRNLAVRLGPSSTCNAIVATAAAATAFALATAYKIGAGAATLALAPAAVCAAVLILRARRDPRPATIATWGVALYATLVTGLAVVYAVTAPR